MAPPRNPPHALPVYLQISEMFAREIAAGRLVDGERLAPERQLAAKLGVSIGTLRKALADLADKGLLHRVQGSGNYVRAAHVDRSLYAMFRLELVKGGGLPSARFLDVTRMEKPAALPAFGTSTEGTRIRRLRFLDHIPVAVEEIWLDGDAGDVRESDLSDSLYYAYRTRLGLSITRAEDRVGLSTVPDWAPPEFAPVPGATTGFIERHAWAEAPAAVEYSMTWFDPDRARYVQRFR